MGPSSRACLAEFAGTFAWVFLSAAVVIAAAAGDVLGLPKPGLVGIALTVGFSYAALLAFTVPLAGGFLNPAVTLVLWVFHRIDSAKAMALAAVQFAGAASGGLAARALCGGREDVLLASRLGTPHLNYEAFAIERIGAGAMLQGMALEAALAFALVCVILGTFFDPRTAKLQGGAPRRCACVVVGMLVAAEVFATYAFTGAAANPARWFGSVIWEATVPALAARHPFADHAVYWIGPAVGALLAGIAYHYLILPKRRWTDGGAE